MDSTFNISVFPILLRKKLGTTTTPTCKYVIDIAIKSRFIVRYTLHRNSAMYENECINRYEHNRHDRATQLAQQLSNIIQYRHLNISSWVLAFIAFDLFQLHYSLALSGHSSQRESHRIINGNQ